MLLLFGDHYRSFEPFEDPMLVKLISEMPESLLHESYVVSLMPTDAARVQQTLRLYDDYSFDIENGYNPECFNEVAAFYLDHSMITPAEMYAFRVGQKVQNDDKTVTGIITSRKVGKLGVNYLIKTGAGDVHLLYGQDLHAV